MYSLQPPPFNDTLSSILGWVSIACWTVVYCPQIYEAYSLKSGEGLSLLFVYIWLLGDITNTTGALLAGLLPTMSILGIYYTLCDITLLVQIYYYRWKSSKSQSSTSDGDEETPLLTSDRTQNSKHVAVTPTKILFLRYTGALLFVIVTGVLAWWISSNTKRKHEVQKPHGPAMTWIIQILGWTSALCYLGSRVPQIIKNFTTRCEGLAPALFFFSILGNTTYSLSICVKSMERDYLITNASWLAGSALTIFLDIIVLSQFSYFRYKALKAVAR
ncbi:hypothetical protein GYMLUDRAFT_212049 [Collybiopsis luxurians FD-317 M1]|nr:hypothetical protein GYMLUDRAFT_212049 [Collybiopsis luxurians FD-317 M1]